jgi:hypothetical protein
MMPKITDTGLGTWSRPFVRRRRKNGHATARGMGTNVKTVIYVSKQIGDMGGRSRQVAKPGKAPLIAVLRLDEPFGPKPIGDADHTFINRNPRLVAEYFLGLFDRVGAGAVEQQHGSGRQVGLVPQPA